MFFTKLSGHKTHKKNPVNFEIFGLIFIGSFLKKFIMWHKIQNIINDEIKTFVFDKPVNKEIYYKEVVGENEFLFFIKPELTLKANTQSFDTILQIILERIEQFHLRIQNIRILNASYLDKQAIIAQHYGVINKLSSDIQQFISTEAKNKFEAIYKQPFSSSKVLGSLEFMRSYPEFSATTLSYLWQNSPTEKLAASIYSQKLILDGKTVFLINGFHPRQLEHFIASGRFIITMTLKGDIDWSLARNNFIGTTNPAEAEPGSIRRELLEKKEMLQLENVSSSWNGVHLSAGPIEGLIELMRYNSNFEDGNLSKPDDYLFGKELMKFLDVDSINKLVSNPIIRIAEKQQSLFDFTEGKNRMDCLEILKGIDL